MKVTVKSHWRYWKDKKGRKRKTWVNKYSRTQKRVRRKNRGISLLDQPSPKTYAERRAELAPLIRERYQSAVEDVRQKREEKAEKKRQKQIQFIQREQAKQERLKQRIAEQAYKQSQKDLEQQRRDMIKQSREIKKELAEQRKRQLKKLAKIAPKPEPYSKEEGEAFRSVFGET